MRVAMYYSNNDVRLEEIPRPKIKPGELLVRVMASGICGSDVMEWYRIHRVPLVLGHEIAGVIEEIGEGIKRYRIGDRISASHHVPCNKCHHCLSGHHTVCETLRKTNFEPGGFAEFIRLPAINVEYGVYLLPEELSFEEATFIEPLACVLRGQRLIGAKKGQTILVIGSGISGLLHIQMAKVNGVNRVVATDVIRYRLETAKRLGADVIFDAKEYTPEHLRQINGGLLADIVILCTGAKSAMEQALKSVERGGTLLFFAATDKDVAVELPINDIFWRNEITLTSSYAATPAEHLEALELIRAHNVNVKDMITHRFGLAQTGEGFRLVAEAKNSIKIVIEPQK
ncbi:MAG: alcohol dehydrogenase [Omnitrophica WOR_2 bacterium SM23_29]|nr:MAG: alcohol dehydrogenase [Omnitrophica WOR_2 bacterium SM23_29]